MDKKEIMIKFQENGIDLIYIAGDVFLVNHSSCKSATFLNVRYNYLSRITTWHVSSEGVDMDKLKAFIDSNDGFMYDYESQLLCYKTHKSISEEDISDVFKTLYEFNKQIESDIDNAEDILLEENYEFVDEYEDYSSIVDC